MNLSSIPPPIALINSCVIAKEPPLDEFSLKDLRSVAHGLQDTDLTKCRSNAESFVHCECALAVAMRPLISGKMEIGVSKSCCWPCLEFLAEYSNQFGRIIVSTTHGKTYHSWLFPSTISHTIHDSMEQTARMDFARWLRSLDGRRTSDSHADSSEDESESLNEIRRVLAEMLKEMHQTPPDDAS